MARHQRSKDSSIGRVRTINEDARQWDFFSRQFFLDRGRDAFSTLGQFPIAYLTADNSRRTFRM